MVVKCKTHSYRTENKLKKHEKVCSNHDYCYVEMPNEDNKTLKYNHGEKSMRVPFIIYADLECLLEKMHSCQNKGNVWCILHQNITRYLPLDI